MRHALGGLIILAAISSAAHADCNPPDRIDARCYPDLQSATAAALAANQSLWLPASTYVQQNTVYIDYTSMAAVGFTVISDGAIIDGSAMAKPVIEVLCQSSCYYFHIIGTLSVWANVDSVTFQIGQHDFGDAHNFLKIDHLIVNNSQGVAVQFNYVLNADVSVYAVGAHLGLWLRQVQFSRLNGAMTGENGYGVVMDDGYSFANTFSGIDVEASSVCLAITSPYANRNTFVSPYFNCPTPIGATAGVRNVLLNPSYGAAQPPTMSSLVGMVSIP